MRALAALPLLGLVLAGCAKGPGTPAVNQYTRLRFSFTMAGDVVQPVGSDDSAYTFSSNYIYIVAIRPLYSTDNGDASDLQPTRFDDTFGPVPVYNATTGNPKNGFVEGQPTRYVLYNPVSQNAYEIHKFGTRSTTPEDQNPIDLAQDSIVGAVVASTDPQSDTSVNGHRKFSFDLYTSDLVNNVANAQRIQAIQFNIIACNIPLHQPSDVSRRVADALGNVNNLGASGKGYYRAIIQTSTTYRSSDSTDPETANDEYRPSQNYLPSVDIVDWTLDVATP